MSVPYSLQLSAYNDTIKRVDCLQLSQCRKYMKEGEASTTVIIIPYYTIVQYLVFLYHLMLCSPVLFQIIQPKTRLVMLKHKEIKKYKPNL